MRDALTPRHCCVKLVAHPVGKGTLAMRLRDALGQCRQMSSVPRSPRSKDNPLLRRGGWQWSRCCKTARISRIGKRPMRCANALTGQTAWDWTSRMLALIPPCSRRFTRVWWINRQKPFCWIGCWRCARNMAGSKRGASNARIPPMGIGSCAFAVQPGMGRRNAAHDAG
jgi:hypothetical protein